MSEERKYCLPPTISVTWCHPKDLDWKIVSSNMTKQGIFWISLNRRVKTSEKKIWDLKNSWSLILRRVGNNWSATSPTNATTTPTGLFL